MSKAKSDFTIATRELQMAAANECKGESRMAAIKYIVENHTGKRVRITGASPSPTACEIFVWYEEIK
jgi:hypothetical protein